MFVHIWRYSVYYCLLNVSICDNQQFDSFFYFCYVTSSLCTSLVSIEIVAFCIGCLLGQCRVNKANWVLNSPGSRQDTETKQTPETVELRVLLRVYARLALMYRQRCIVCT